MRRPHLRLLAPAAALLLATACGTEHADDGPGSAAPPPRTTVSDPPVDGVRITSVTLPTAAPSPSATPGRVHADPLPGTGDSGISAAYRVGNDGADAMTYTVLFAFTTDTGAVMASRKVTVAGVAPGRSTTGTVEAGALAPGASPVTRVKVAEVTKVPADEAPSRTGPCPASGVRLWADDGDAAMGLRVVGLHLENCGKRDYPLDGYPQLTLLDDDREPVDGVRVLHGGTAIATGTGLDGPPAPLVLKPGESALSGLIWRNTTLSGTAVNVPYVRVLAKPGAAPVMLTPRLDLGTTGRLGVGAWKRAGR